MTHSKSRIIIGISAVIVAVVAVGAFVPLGSYTTTHGCPTNPTPTVRISLIMGESLSDIRAADKPQLNPLIGCSMNTTYVQYLL